MVQMCKIIICPGVFFNFQILIFRVVRGLKRQKMAQNDKMLVSLRISGTVYHMTVIFGTHGKVMISPANFFIFQNIDFWVFVGVKGQKMT